MAISKILYMKDCGNHFHGKHLKQSLDYVMNPEKTQNGRLIGGMNCQPEGYTFYCDGKEVSRADKHVSHVPQFILLTTEVQGYRKSVPNIISGDFVDDAFIVDFVRVFDKVR